MPPPPTAEIAPAPARSMVPSAISRGIDPFCPPCNNTFDRVVWGVLRALAGGVCMWHGYTRNRGSWGWAVLWFLAGSMAPVVATSVLCIQRYRDGQWPFPPAALAARGSQG